VASAAQRTTADLIRHYFECANAMSPTALGNRTLPPGPPRNPLRVMFCIVGPCEQPIRSGAHGCRSHRLGALLSARNFCQISVTIAKHFHSGAIAHTGFTLGCAALAINDACCLKSSLGLPLLRRRARGRQAQTLRPFQPDRALRARCCRSLRRKQSFCS
jgi:hypothetical protein